MNDKILENLTDDKSLVIFALTLFGVIALFRIADAPHQAQLMSNIVSGLLGMAVGKSMGKNNP